MLLVALTLQLGVASSITFFGVQADLLLLVAIAAGIAAGPDRGAAIGFAAGLAYDLMLQTPFGLSALTYALIAYLVGSLQDSVLRAAWWIPVATATAATRARCHPVRRGRAPCSARSSSGWELLRIAAAGRAAQHDRGAASWSAPCGGPPAR